MAASTASGFHRVAEALQHGQTTFLKKEDLLFICHHWCDSVWVNDARRKWLRLGSRLVTVSFFVSQRRMLHRFCAPMPA